MQPSPSPPLPGKPLNPRQERFCHYFVLYACASVAAKEAGYSRKSSKHQGYRLLRTGRVRARIRDIHAGLARDHGRDIDALIGKLEAVYRRAFEDHHFHTAARAVELQARLSMLNERRAVTALPVLPPSPLEKGRPPQSFSKTIRAPIVDPITTGCPPNVHPITTR